mmetsp:Transcript_29789/g.72159  ORF Transcript_29789/g.72159 Transcript_29789/m.72159 type:complete len:215 (+) Transcript_29789:1448-2092(+)
MIQVVSSANKSTLLLSGREMVVLLVSCPRSRTPHLSLLVRSSRTQSTTAVSVDRSSTLDSKSSGVGTSTRPWEKKLHSNYFMKSKKSRRLVVPPPRMMMTSKLLSSQIRCCVTTTRRRQKTLPPTKKMILQCLSQTMMAMKTRRRNLMKVDPPSTSLLTMSKTKKRQRMTTIWIWDWSTNSIWKMTMKMTTRIVRPWVKCHRQQTSGTRTPSKS